VSTASKPYRLIFAFLVSILCCHCSLAADELADQEKLKTIYDMYADYRMSFPEVEDVTPRVAMGLMKSEKVVFVDIREPKEQRVSMLPGAITGESFGKDSEKYKDHIVISYCTISYRSGVFARGLRNRGVIIYNLKGGLLAWVHEGGKVYDAKGETKRIHVYGKKWDYPPAGYEAVR
jgi:sodium/bile acid cotransporter 7